MLIDVVKTRIGWANVNYPLYILQCICFCPLRCVSFNVHGKRSNDMMKITIDLKDLRKYQI